MAKITEMDPDSLAYNIRFCDRLIASYTVRIPMCEYSGEDPDDLKLKLKNYKAKLRELKAIK